MYRWVEGRDRESFFESLFRGRNLCKNLEFSSCPNCGKLTFGGPFIKKVSTHIQWEYEDKVIDIYEGDKPCEDCDEVFSRSPEVARWVMTLAKNMLFEKERKGI